jgi:hypothetical protein
MQEAYGGQEFMPNKKKKPGRIAQGAHGSTRGPSYEAGDERTTDDEPKPDFKPAGTDEAAQAKPEGGAGLTQGAPDKAPPPSPEKPLSKNRSGARCRDRNWWYSSKTGNCYHSKESCEAAALHQGTCEQSL